MRISLEKDMQLTCIKVNNIRLDSDTLLVNLEGGSNVVIEFNSVDIARFHYYLMVNVGYLDLTVPNPHIKDYFIY